MRLGRRDDHIRAKVSVSSISTVCICLEFGHFEEQFPRLTSHPVRRMADHPLPKGEGEIRART